MILARDLAVFVDEYGGPGLDLEKEGPSKFYIVTAVIVDASALSAVRKAAENVRQRFFQTGEMKSSKISDNDGRRILVLNAINTLNAKTYSLIVDKRELDRESGLAYRRSFYKYISRRLYDRLVRAFENVDLVADEFGTAEFMATFPEYLHRQLVPDLFSKRTFKFASSSDEVLLQVADVVSGSFARAFDPDKLSERSAEILALLGQQSIGIAAWPPRSLPAINPAISPSVEAKHDELVREHCRRQAQLFLEGVDRDQPDGRLQAEVVEYLLFQAEFFDDRAFIPTQRLIEYLEGQLRQEVSAYHLRTVAIAPLRDAGVIIASSAKGYKLPVSEADLAQFVMHANTIVPPMLSRLRRAREALLLASLGDLDILGVTEFSLLRQLVDVDGDDREE